MNYTVWETLLLFFTYAVLGWAGTVAADAFRTGRFVNTGTLNGPVNLTSGIVLTLAAILSEQYAANFFGLFLLTAMIITAAGPICGFLSERVLGRKLWDYTSGEYNTFNGWKGLVRTLISTLLALIVVLFLHPYLYIAIQLIPPTALKVIDTILLVVLGLDLLSTFVAMRVIRRWENRRLMEVSASLRDIRMTWGSRLVSAIRRRLWKAFPELADAPNRGDGFGRPAEGRVFARGLCVHKLFWVFLICALMGDLIETVFVWVTSGVLMSRSSLLYGTFSVVWGLGGVLFTIVLAPLRERSDRFVFFGGFLLGGAYEYLCSVFTEIVFGTVFWDYSDMPFNIQGRTNLLFMFFWGVMALVWVKAIDPVFNRGIEKIPPVLGTVLTWILAVLMALDIGVTGLAMGRYVARSTGAESANTVESFLDNQYPDELIEWVWPNMVMVEE
ncbi:MAG: putative ABC transporter permease [Clostridiales bacterium]|nr:putative ABC transporter permease [Clostridiales bacterium]